VKNVTKMIILICNYYVRVVFSCVFMYHLGLPDAFSKNTGILSTVPDLSCLNSQAVQGKRRDNEYY